MMNMVNRCTDNKVVAKKACIEYLKLNWMTSLLVLVSRVQARLTRFQGALTS